MSDLSDYKDVAERCAEFFERYPEGSLQSDFLGFDATGKFVIVRAAAYRTPSDPRPGTGLAWEPVPGKTSFTKDSELMNAETSAWGRAIVAVGASTSKHIASADEVRNRSSRGRGDQSPSQGIKKTPAPAPESVKGGGSPAQPGRAASAKDGTDAHPSSSPSPHFAPQSVIKQLQAFLRSRDCQTHEERVNYLGTSLGRVVESSAHVTTEEAKKVMFG